MNNLEMSSVGTLSRLIDNYGVLGIKTSFEDEGASFNEVIRLKELCNQAGTKILLKISGAEAKRDLNDAITIGVKGIVAPMIESPFALEKFIESVKNILGEEMMSNTQLGINIETIQAFNNFDEISKSDAFDKLYHVTLGRVDFAKSMGKDRSYCDSKDLFDKAVKIFTKSKNLSKRVYLGGAISNSSKDFISSLYKMGLLDKFETRYVIYDPTIALKKLDMALLEGQKLELDILKNRMNYHSFHSKKEIQRIEMIEKRIKQK